MSGTKIEKITINFNRNIAYIKMADDKEEFVINNKFIYRGLDKVVDDAIAEKKDEIKKTVLEQIKNSELRQKKEKLPPHDVTFAVPDEELQKTLASLEEKNLVKLYRKRGSISMAKATYTGLNQANPPEYYRWFPAWVEEDNIF